MKVKERVGAGAGVAVVSEKQGEVLPVIEFKCRKCGNKKAYFWTRQMRAGDEAESKFYKCNKCKNVERVDD